MGARLTALLLFVLTTCHAQSPHFEVASVKPSPQQRLGTFSGGPGSRDPERITYESTTLENLIRDAYHLLPYQISGPSWLTSEYYTVAAKLPPGATVDQYRQMMANLLAERFGLVSHRVMKDFAGYEITVAPGGIKLTPVAKTDDFPEFRGNLGTDGLWHYRFTQTSMHLMENRLSLILAGRNPGSPLGMSPIADKTGLTERFDFHLDFAAPEPDDLPSALIKAMREQLGLILKPVKIELEVVVVDNANKIPTEN
jgi:uncharacterized protein (TIGR03435 family)